MKTLLAKRRSPKRCLGVETLEGRALLSGAADRLNVGTQQVEHIAATPNDPEYTAGRLWGLNGPNGIQAPAAWDVTTGSNQVTIAVIDTGVDYNHPDLYQNIWINQAEIPASRMKNLTDVDGDGLITFADLNNPVNIGPGKITDVNGDGRIDAADILAPMMKDANGNDTGAGGWADPTNVQDGDTAHPDDLIGWNFVTNTNDPFDDVGHGTEAAGIIAATGNNGVGIVGVNWTAQVMALKFIDSSGNGTNTNAAAAILYAARHGARVANASFGAYGASMLLHDAIATAGTQGLVVVAGAGNDGLNTDSSPFFPASFNLPNLISVAATDQNAQLVATSNYGLQTVDLGAPGTGIETTLPSNAYGLTGGSSASTPFVTGTVALVTGLHPSWAAAQIVRQILGTVTPATAMAGKTVTGGILNANAAVSTVVATTPTINWQAPLDIVFGTPLSATQLDATATAYGNPVAGQFTYTPALGTVLNAGAGQTLSVTFTPDNARDYNTASASVTINVLKAMPTIMWSQPSSIAYGTPLGVNQLDATANVPGTFAYAPLAGAVPGAGVQTLSVTFTPSDTTDYNTATATTTLNVTKAHLSVLAGNNTIRYGDPIPPLSYAIAGFLKGDTPGVVSGKPALTTTAMQGSGIGSYPITVGLGTLSAANYDFPTFTNGTLTITRAHLTVSADNKTRVKGAANPPLTYSVTGLVNGDTPAVIAGAPTLSTPATVASAVGVYPIPIAAGTLSAANYDFPTLLNGSLTVIAPRPSVDFVIGADDQVYTRPLDGSGFPANTYYQIANKPVKDLAAIRLGMGATTFEAFVVGTDNIVYAETISGAVRSGYFRVAFGSIASVSAGTDKNGNPLLFAVGTDNQLYEVKFNSSGSPLGGGSYVKASSGDFKSTVLTHDIHGNPLLYALGQDNQVYGLKLDAAGTPSGTLFKVDSGAVNQLVLGHDAANVPEIFVVGADNSVKLHKLDGNGSPIGGYVVIGGPVASISVTSDFANNPELFAISPPAPLGDGQIYGHKFDAFGNPAGSFFGVGAAGLPGGSRSICAGVDQNNNPNLFAVSSTDGQVYAAPFSAKGDPIGPFIRTVPGKVKKVVLT